MDKDKLKEEKLKKFQEAGIPIPMKVVQPGLKSNSQGNTPMHKILEQIKNGAKKKEFDNILKKDDSSTKFQPLPTPKQKKAPGQPDKAVPKIADFTPNSKGSSEAQMLEATLYGGASKSVSTSSVASAEGDIMKPMPERDILTTFRNRMSQKGIQPNVETNLQEQSEQTNSIGLQITEEQLKNKIIFISKQVATQISKKMIKNVLTEYIKSEGGLIIESARVKKAEIVDKNKVKIDGKIYKLTPVK